MKANFRPRLGDQVILEPVDVVFSPKDFLPPGRHSHEITLMNRCRFVALNHPVSLANRIVGLHVNIGKSIKDRLAYFLLSSPPSGHVETRNMQDAIRRPGFVHYIEARLVLEFFQKLSNDCDFLTASILGHRSPVVFLPAVVDFLDFVDRYARVIKLQGTATAFMDRCEFEARLRIMSGRPIRAPPFLNNQRVWFKLARYPFDLSAECCELASNLPINLGWATGVGLMFLIVEQQLKNLGRRCVKVNVVLNPAELL